MSNDPTFTADGHPHGVEPVPVVLARMEGVLNGIDYKVGDLMRRVERAEGDIDDLQSLTQSLSEGVVSHREAAHAMAAALREAEDARRVQEAKAWTPFARTFALTAALASIVGIVFAFRAGA